MVKDERIKATVQRYASHGFILWYVLLLFDLNFRLFYLRQPVTEYWDIFVIFLGVCFYVSIAFLTRGVYAHNLKRQSMIIFPVIFISILATNYFRGGINSPGELLGHLLGLVIGLMVFLLIIFYLNHRWIKKSGLDE